MDSGDRPTKRARMTPERSSTGNFDANADFVPFEQIDDIQNLAAPTNAPNGPRRTQEGQQPRRVDPRNRFDRPKSKHPLPGCDPWILVKTKLGRRFVHNTETLQSVWRIPQSIRAGIEAYDDQQEKQKNSKWAEQQLDQMRTQASKKTDLASSDTSLLDERQRRRRSESLQREDEEAAMAELAAQRDNDDEEDVDTNAISAMTNEPRGYLGAASDSEYEYIEVTDSEGEHEEDDDDQAKPLNDRVNDDREDGTTPQEAVDPGPVELGEDDIAYQLAMMGESYGLDEEEYGVPDDDQEMDDGEAALEPTTEEATAIFHEMLDEHGVSPFTPWEKVIADTTSTSVVLDDRYTLLPSSKARKDAWDIWSRDRAAQIQRERAFQEKRDPRIAFLSFLAKHATTKLYWPEFKRKFKREPELNDRGLHDKDREKLYRELVAKLKLPEARREDELRGLLKTLPKDKSNGLAPVPEKVLINAVFYSVPATGRQKILETTGYRGDQIA